MFITPSTTAVASFANDPHIICQGGDTTANIVYSNANSKLHSFISSGAANLTVFRSQGNALALFMLGGGGGGGGALGGGGGSGDLNQTVINVRQGQQYRMTVGVGGTGGVGVHGGDGGNTFYDSRSQLGITISANVIGGGGGGMMISGTPGNGRPGGSGGGSSVSDGGSTPGTGAAGYGGAATGTGNAGGDSPIMYFPPNQATMGAGGGGLGAVGGNGGDPRSGPVHAQLTGNGASGLQSDFSGANVYYGGGGGGGGATDGSVYGYPTGQGGLGGGGNAAMRASGTANSVARMAVAGTDGTGGGGGAGSNDAAPYEYGAAGGSGLVMVRYTID